MQKRIYFYVIALFLFTPFFLSSQYLHVSGKKILDPNGSEILLKGIGLGGWLVPEGYMLQTSGIANSPREIRNKIESLIGAAETELFYQRYRANFVTRKDIEMIASLGFNSVRLAMHYNLLSPRDQPYVYLESGFVIIDSLLKQCEDNHIFLILDLHCAFGGQNSANISDYDPSYPSLWEDVTNRQRTVDLWKKLAQRYSNKQWIGGYDLLNETVWTLPGNYLLRSLYIDITNAIRTVDQNHIIFIEGNNWANDFTGLTPPWDENLVYSFHKYWNTNDVGSIQSYLNLRNTANRPLWLGETGENNNKWFTDCATLVEQNNIGWSWWTLKKVESVSGFFSVKKPAEYEAVLKYWKGTGPKPSNADCIAAFTKLADNLLLENCVFNPGVIDALIRQPKSYLTVPYKANAIPGIVYASDYDYGRSGFAYNDTDNDNSGGQYRNDNVDIESCSDAVSNGYNIGWLNTSEFLKYTVNIQQGGTYKVIFRAAANAAGGSIQIKVDNSAFSGLISIPQTGGWQMWSDVVLNSITLPSGTHSITMNIVSGGFNLNYLKFELISPSYVEPNSPYLYWLGQNYPNPFNPSTSIDFSIAKAGSVSITIFNTLGKTVKQYTNEYSSPGKYSVSFSGESLPSGVYFYKLQSEGFTKTLKMLLIK